MLGGITLAAGSDDCPLWQGFDFSAAATIYSQLTGVLAGFAFVAITLMLNRQHRREALGVGDPVEELAQDRRNIAGLGCAFLGLLATTVMYATISAERACALTDGRVASEEVLAGVAFAFSLYTLLFAAVQLVSAASLGTHLRFVVAVIVPPIVVMLSSPVWMIWLCPWRRPRITPCRMNRCSRCGPRAVARCGISPTRCRCGFR